MCGDGWLYHYPKKGDYKIGLKAKDKDFVEKFNQILCTLLKRDILYPIRERVDNHPKHSNQYEVKGYSKSLFKFLEKGLPNFRRYVQPFPADFIRGFADSEASAVKAKQTKSGQISFPNTDLQLIQYVKELLRELEIKTTNMCVWKYKNKKMKPRYDFYICQRPQIEKYAKLIGFGIKRKQKTLEKLLRYIRTGSNRRWSPEERQLLKKLYPKMSNRELSQKFGRSIGAIKIQAYLIDLYKNYGTPAHR